MAYQQLRKEFPDDLVREILQYTQDYSPDRSSCRELQVETIHYAIVWVVPVVRQKKTNWKVIVGYNPFVLSWLYSKGEFR
jgi:hypothetical protein